MPARIFSCTGVGKNSLGILSMEVTQWEEAEDRKRQERDRKAPPIQILAMAQSHPTPEETILTIFYR